MAEVWLLDQDASRTGRSHEIRSIGLTQRLPRLCVAAREAAASIMHGVHGRRRAGPGETFWQFRPFAPGEAAGRIDWRRSAKDDRLYVREREWEAAHTVLIWIDRSPSMWFASNLALEAKVDRALVLGLAAAELLVRGGERAGLLGLMPPVAARNIIERFAAALLAQESSAGYVPEELPTPAGIPAGAQAILTGDFLADPQAIAGVIESLSSAGIKSHLVLIADPVEETFPFSGNTEFLDVDSPARLRAGEAQALRQEYTRRLARHRAAIAASARKRGFSLILHRTDRPATEALLTLAQQLATPGLSAFGRQGGGR